MVKFRPEQLWQALVEAGTHVLFVTDSKGTIVHVNALAEQLLGQPRKDLVGKLATFFDAEEIAVRARALTKAQKREIPADYRALAWEALHGAATVRECTVVSGARRRRALKWIIAPLRGVDAKVTGVLWLARAENAAFATRGRRDLLAAALRSLDDAFVTLDVNGSVTTWNHGATSMFGYTEREMVGQSLTTIAQAEHGWEGPVLVDRVVRGKKITPFETERRHKNGSTIHVRMSLSAIRTDEGAVAGIAVLLSPIRRRLTAKEEAGEGEQRLLRALESGNGGVWDWDVDADELYLSPQLKRTVGLSEEKSPAVPMSTFAERVHPAYRAALENALEANISSGAVLDLECRVGNEDDEVRWFSIRGQCQPKEADGPQRIVGTMTDITKQVAQRDELRAALSRAQEYERLFELGNGLPAIIGFDGHFRRLGPGWERALGYTRAELYAMPWQDLVVDEDIEHTSGELSRLESEGGELSSLITRLHKKDGDFARFAWTVKADRDAELLYAFAHDVTNLGGGAGAGAVDVDRSSVLLVEAADSVAFGAWELDTESGQFSASSVVHDLLDLPPNEGATLDALVASFTQDGQVLLRAAMDEAASSGAPFDMEVEIPKAGDGPRWIRVRGQGSVEGDTIRRVHGTLQDITQEKAREAERSQFVSVVSHELRTPLTSIRGAMKLLEAGVVGELPEKFRELVEVASSNSHRLVELVNDILDLEKMEVGRFEMRREDVDLGAVVERAAQELQAYAQQLDVKLVVEDGPRRQVVGDPDRLVQALVNLVGNSLKYSSAGKMVRVAVSEGLQGRVRVTIKDEGPGISSEEIARLFKKFQQMPAARADHAVGTGLGLAVAKAIVEQHGGQVGVESVVGLGTTFWFELESVESIEPAKHEVEVSEGFRDILLIEDDEAIAGPLPAMLSEQGYRVRRVPRLAEAEAAVHSSLPEAIVLDVLLPDGSGVEWLTALRAQPGFAEVPVVVLRGRDDATPQGTPSWVDWLVKPLDMKELVGALRRAVRRPGRPRALLVEDDPGIRTVLCAQIDALGIDCTTASDGAVAVEVADEVDPDLIVLDLSMPRMNGFEVVEALKHQKLRGVPLLVYTGHELTDAEKATLQLGVTKHLTKARSTEEEFTGAVRDLLGSAMANCQDREAGE